MKKRTEYDIVVGASIYNKKPLDVTGSDLKFSGATLDKALKKNSSHTHTHTHQYKTLDVL